jgi:hypothetical protein
MNDIGRIARATTKVYHCKMHAFFRLSSCAALVAGSLGCTEVLGFNDREVVSEREYEAIQSGECPEVGCPDDYDYDNVESGEGDDFYVDDGVSGSGSGVSGQGEVVEDPQPDEPFFDPDEPAGVGGSSSDSNEPIAFDNFTCDERIAGEFSTCPEECTGGCTPFLDGMACIIDCSETSACQDTVVTCPEGIDCGVMCAGLSSCSGMELLCPSGSNCGVFCMETSTCQGVDVWCPEKAGDCVVSCQGTSSCQGSTVHCTTGACAADCVSESASLGDLSGAESACQASTNCELSGSSLR